MAKSVSTTNASTTIAELPAESNMKRQGVFTYPEIDRVVFGMPFVEALKTEADRPGDPDIRSGERNLSARTIACPAGNGDGWSDRGCLRPAAAACAARGRIGGNDGCTGAGADLILTVGGGTPTDAAKMVVLSCKRRGRP